MEKDLNQFFVYLWDLLTGLLKSTSLVFNWLFDSHKIAFEVFGFYIGFDVVPIYYLGGGLLALLLLWFIKGLVPILG